MPWPSTRLQDLLGIDLPIIQAPMAGAQSSAMAIAVSQAAGLGSLPCAMLTPDKARGEIDAIRQATPKPYNVNFFCHRPPAPAPEREAAWREQLPPYYAELGLDPATPVNARSPAPFNEAMRAVLEELSRRVVSVHFGLPDEPLLAREENRRRRIGSSDDRGRGTVVRSARLRCDHRAGSRSGRHRGLFLTDDLNTQLPTLALVDDRKDRR
jgi:nitronate monooxygenase